ncbi:MAG: hypothetical protein WD426_09470 [Anditalea sp.]
MDNELIRIFSEELRETKKLVVETSRMADAATKGADAAMKKADAAWELVIITRNQVQEEIAYLKLPWWKKVFGTGNSS